MKEASCSSLPSPHPPAPVTSASGVSALYYMCYLYAAEAPPSDLNFSHVGIVQTNTTLSVGIRTSYPTWDGGLMILIHQTFPVDIWLFLKPFAPSLWLAIFATAVFLGICIWLNEIQLEKVKANPGASWAKYGSIQFASLGLLLQGIKDVTVHSPGGRLAVLGFCFLVVIIINS